MSKYTDAIEFVDIVRMNYICDPHECGLEKGGDTCRVFHCDEMHDALVMAIEALEIADRLEQADAEKHSDDWFIRDDNSEFDRGYSIGFQEGYNTALADIRGDNNG